MNGEIKHPKLNMAKIEALIARNKAREDTAFMASFKPVDVPDFVHPGVPLSDRIWMGAKHFLYGFVIAGGTAFQTTGNWTTALVAGLVGGAAGATRKIVKETRKDQGKDWSDFLDRLLELAILLVKVWRERRKE